VYFGVEEGCKAHRLYDPKTNKIIVSRDVVFEELEVWKWSSTIVSGNSVEFVVENEIDSGTFSHGSIWSVGRCSV
jgi:hypothetical protein